MIPITTKTVVDPIDATYNTYKTRKDRRSIPVDTVTDSFENHTSGGLNVSCKKDLCFS